MSEPVTPQPPKKELPPEVVDSIADKLDAILDKVVGPRDWKPIIVAVIGGITALVLLWSGYSSMISELQKNRQSVVEKAKDDHTPLEETNKLLRDGFRSLEQSFDDGFRTLGQKIDAKPKPEPKPPLPPSPVVKLSLPESVTVAVGAIAKIKANASSPVAWYWPASDGIAVDMHGDTLYVTPSKAGTYWIAAYTSNGGKVSEFAACMVTTNTAPQPPPGPTPPVPPTPTPSPISVPGMRVLIVYEEMARDKLTSAQRAILGGVAMRDFLDSVCVVGPDNKTKEWRMWDKDVPINNAEPLWRDMFARPRASVPWIVVSNYPKGGYEGPLPTSVDEFKTIIQKVQ